MVQDLATQWIQSYQCKTKTSQETEKSLRKSLSSRLKSRKSFTLAIRWNLANLVKTHHGIIVHRHSIDPRRMDLLRERYAEYKKGRLLLQSGLDEKWWADSMECYCYFRNVQDFQADVKTLYERRFGEPFKGPIIPFGSMVEHHLFLEETCRDCISSARKSYQEYSSVMYYTWEESGKETFWSQTLRSCKIWMHQKSVLGGSMQKRF